ncbi:hypothetical protein DPMN_005814 [Dreissena polymorpha]|uniref:Uncharacterized protein n=1 Tax=Dreissena polymorpha TaxID=45954 RepID=A0A9D4MQC5_DREPO|nr:hypothetical protein DPMN_005814 [Dreissena polymorpha]
MLNKYFASQCSLDENNHALPSMHHANANTLQSIHITHEEVIDSIKCLKIGKASGPDGIDNRIELGVDKTYERFTTEAYTSRPEKVTITDDLLGDFSEEAEPNACGRWAGLKRVG